MYPLANYHYYLLQKIKSYYLGLIYLKIKFLDKFINFPFFTFFLKTIYSLISQKFVCIINRSEIFYAVMQNFFNILQKHYGVRKFLMLFSLLQTTTRFSKILKLSKFLIK